MEGMEEIKAGLLVRGNLFVFEGALYLCLSSVFLRHTHYVLAVDISSRDIKDFGVIDAALIDSDCKVRVYKNER